MACGCPKRQFKRICSSQCDMLVGNPKGAGCHVLQRTIAGISLANVGQEGRAHDNAHPNQARRRPPLDRCARTARLGDSASVRDHGGRCRGRSGPVRFGKPPLREAGGTEQHAVRSIHRRGRCPPALHRARRGSTPRAAAWQWQHDRGFRLERAHQPGRKAPPGDRVRPARLRAQHPPKGDAMDCRRAGRAHLCRARATRRLSRPRPGSFLGCLGGGGPGADAPAIGERADFRFRLLPSLRSNRFCHHVWSGGTADRHHLGSASGGDGGACQSHEVPSRRLH